MRGTIQVARLRGSSAETTVRDYLLEELVLGDLLEERAESHATKTFLRFHEGELTYREVAGAARRLARGFAALGVREQDAVAVMLPNGPEFLYAIFALARLGAVAIPVNGEHRGEMLEHVIRSSGASVLVVGGCFLDRVAPVLERLPERIRVVVQSKAGARAAGERLERWGVPLERLLGGRGDAPRARVEFGDLQAIMFTSGTTGLSKGVMVPHALALTCALDSLRFVGGAGETIYCPLPLFHAAALWDGVLASLLSGGTIAIVERFRASRFWDDVRHFGARLAMGVPSMIPILLAQPATPEDAGHPLHTFYMGKSALDEGLRRRFGVRAVETYTSTELGIATASPYGDWRAGSCGQANRERFEVQIVDDRDRPLGPGEPGELVVRPRQPYVMTPGYYGFGEATAGCFRNLWFHTGDRAYRDEEGYFYFVDRIKDAIRRRGENVSAFELERAINAHPRVLECAAVGVPSELEDEDIKVVVVRRPGATLGPEELIHFCEQRVASFMVPRFVEFVAELPRTATQKVAKHELRRAGDHGITPHTWDREKGAARSGRPAL